MKLSRTASASVANRPGPVPQSNATASVVSRGMIPCKANMGNIWSRDQVRRMVKAGNNKAEPYPTARLFQGNASHSGLKAPSLTFWRSRWSDGVQAKQGEPPAHQSVLRVAWKSPRCHACFE